MAIFSAIGGAVTANKQANAIKDAGAASNATMERIYNQTREDFAPWTASGKNALAALDYELGLGERPEFVNNALNPGLSGEPAPPPQISLVEGGPLYNTVSGRGNDTQVLAGFDVDKYVVDGVEFLERSSAQDYLDQLLAERDSGQPEAFEYRGFQETPGYQFQLDEMQRALERSAASRGMLQSGAFAKGMERYSQGLASQEYNTHLNRLAAQANVGQVATGQTSAAGQNFAQGVSNNLMNVGAGRASAYGNTHAGIQSGIQNTAGIFGTLYGAGAF